MDPRLARRIRKRIFAGLLTACGTLLSSAALVAPAWGLSSQDSVTVTFTPRDIWPPSSVTDLVGSPGAEGQMLLEWTAPDANNYRSASRTPASRYEIRVATFSVDSVGGSTTTWWNQAIDVISLPAPAVPAAPPTPLAPGTTQTLLLNQLEPGVTYYAMLVSYDGPGNVSDADLASRTPGGQAQALVADVAPPAPTALAAVAVGSTSFAVSWSSPSAYDLDEYRLSIDSTSPYDYADAVVVVVDSPTAAVSLTGLKPGSYRFRVTAVDKGAPSYPGRALESLPSAEVVGQFALRLPQETFGVAISTAGGVSLRWMPVSRYADGVSFVDPAAPTADELSGYRVYRSTLPVLAAWSEQAAVSSATLTWTDLAGGPQYYYNVRSENSSGLSTPSVVRSVGSRSAYIVAPDQMSVLEVLSKDIAPIEGVAGDPTSAYLIKVSSHPEDLGGRVLKSLEFQAWKGGQELVPGFELEDMGWLRLRYAMTRSSVVPSALAPTPENMSVYWFNGRGWVQLFGRLSTADKTMRVQTKYLGRYELRSVERTRSFAFDAAGVSNKIVTPNGDGKNDSVVFTYDNPRDSQVSVRIFDLQGRLVVSSLPPGPVSHSAVWDGTANGHGVPGGIYIYQIEAEGRVYSGTIVIVK